MSATRPCPLQNLGFDWAFKHGVLDAEEQYPYQGVSNYCRNTSDKAIHFKVCTVPAFLARAGTFWAVAAACHLRVRAAAADTAYLLHAASNGHLASTGALNASPDQLAADLQGNYTIVDGSEYGLKEALFTKGGTLFAAYMCQD